MERTEREKAISWFHDQFTIGIGLEKAWEECPSHSWRLWFAADVLSPEARKALARAFADIISRHTNAHPTRATEVAAEAPAQKDAPNTTEQEASITLSPNAPFDVTRAIQNECAALLLDTVKQAWESRLDEAP